MVAPVSGSGNPRLRIGLTGYMVSLRISLVRTGVGSERIAVQGWLCVGTCHRIGGGRKAEAFEEIQVLRRGGRVLRWGWGFKGSGRLSN